MKRASISQLIDNGQDHVSFLSGQLIPIVQDYINRYIFDYKACLEEWGYALGENDLIELGEDELLVGQFCMMAKDFIKSGENQAQFYAGLIVGCIAGEDKEVEQ